MVRELLVSYPCRWFSGDLGGFVKLSTVRRAAICVVLSASRLSFAQSVTLTTKSKEMRHGTGVRLELLLNAHSNLAPAGLQWEFRLPPGLQIAEIEVGKAAKKAGKTLVCNGAKCLVYGLTRATIPNGQIAIAKIRVAQGLDGTKGSAQFGYQTQSRNRKQEVQIVDAVAASLEGKTIKVVSGSAATSASSTP
jgi:hypothetical protein